MADISYDTLTIQINADSKVATKNINTLNRGLKNLDKTAQELNKDKIEEVKGLLLDIANIDFSNVANGLRDVVSAFKAFQSKAFMKATSNGNNLSGAYPNGKTPTYDGTNLPKFEAFQQGDLKGFNEFVDNLKQANQLSGELQGNLSGVMEVVRSGLTPMEQMGEKFAQIGLNRKQVEAIFKSINYETDRFSPQQLEEVERILMEIGGMTGEQAKKTIERLKKELSETDKNAKKSSRSFATMFKNIMRYRVVRKMIQSIFQEITNAFSELASVDKDFDQSLGEIKSAFSFLARTLVSVIAPIIKAIAPIITQVAQGLGEVFNMIGGIFAGELGQDQFAEATENVETYTESLKKAKSVSTGLDEMNVIGQEQGGNFEIKETQKVETNLSETLKKLIESIKPIFEALKGFVEKIQPLLSVIIDIFSQILNETMGSVNDSVANFINVLGTILNVIGRLLQALSPIISFLITIADTGLNLINDVLSVLFILINDLLQPLLPIITLIGEVLKLIAPALQFIGEALKGITGRTENTGARVVSGILTGGLSELFRAFRNKGFATGGFPEDGLFFANSGELVGEFSNGKTAVANNQQITQGIYQAVLQALRDGGGMGSDVNVYLDSREIAKRVEERQNQKGISFVKEGSNL